MCCSLMKQRTARQYSNKVHVVCLVITNVQHEMTVVCCVSCQFTKHRKAVPQRTSSLYDTGTVCGKHLPVVWTQRYQAQLPRRLGHSVWYVCVLYRRNWGSQFLSCVTETALSVWDVPCVNMCHTERFGSRQSHSLRQEVVVYCRIH